MRARKAIESAFADDELACRDISPWELAMLVARKRIDPADRLIAATARLHQAPLVTSDTQLRRLKEVTTIW